MNLDKIETKLLKISSKLEKKNFIYDFLLAYDLPKSSINRLKKGDYNKSKKNNEIIWNKKIYFYQTDKNEDVHYVIDEIEKNESISKFNIRFIIVTDFSTFLSIDLKTKETLDININELSKNSEFFLPLTGLEKSETINESLIDIKAAGKLGKLFDSIVSDNPDFMKSEKKRHGLNIFFTRIIFCFFAEDSNIFQKAQFGLTYWDS